MAGIRIPWIGLRRPRTRPAESLQIARTLPARFVGTFVDAAFARSSRSPPTRSVIACGEAAPEVARSATLPNRRARQSPQECMSWTRRPWPRSTSTRGPLDLAGLDMRELSPVEYFSGNRLRRRLNRGGNRQANAALHRIVLSRLRWDAKTRVYYERRLAEGKTRREIIRCLKRYVAREIYHLVQAQHQERVAHRTTQDHAGQ